MRRNHRAFDDSTPGGSWMDTYGDMVTLLLTFFVMLYSFSTINAAKWQGLVGTLTGGKKAIGTTDTSNIAATDKTTAPTSFEEASKLVEETTNNSSDQKSEQVINADASSKVTASSPAKKATQTKSSATGKNASASSSKTSSKTSSLTALYKDLNQYVSSKNGSSGVSVTMGSGSLTIRFVGTVLFDPGSATIKPQAKGVLHDISGIINDHIKSISLVESQGHTDNAPVTGSAYHDNWELSGDRAYNVLTELINTGTVDPHSLKFSGLGEEHPIASNDTQAGRNKNNRVDIIIS
ncbi:MAG: flagellar motor protein MotB [Bacillota bacterium]|nr:flagellar motor protein MotB [Bacillota bacterium]